VRVDPHVKTALTIDEADNPLRIKLHWNTPKREVSEDSRIASSLSCGLSPCLPDFYCRPRNKLERRVPSSC
jgi:hypothetical protein